MFQPLVRLAMVSRLLWFHHDSLVSGDLGICGRYSKGQCGSRQIHSASALCGITLVVVAPLVDMVGILGI
jgi:hypothetical protein